MRTYNWEQVRSLERKLGIEPEWGAILHHMSDAEVEERIASLEELVNRRRSGSKPLTDGEIIKAAGRWHNASLLEEYMKNTPEYQRDLDQIGCYTLFELKGHKLVPLFVESTPRYVGESKVLSQRLRHHVTGGFDSNPADHVIQEYLRFTATAEQKEGYATTYTKGEQRALRRLAMGHRRFWVQTIHMDSKTAARRLEDSMAQLYRSQGYDIWNTNPKPRPYIA